MQDVRAKARDAVRKGDLRQIATALELYRSDKGNYIVKNSGVSCGKSYTDLLPTINGGFFNFNASSNPNVDECLYDGKYLGGIIQDPSKPPFTSPYYNNNGSPYMIAISTDGSDKYTIWTSLEKPSASDLATQSKCSLDRWDSYTGSWPAERRMNYCVSN